MSPREQCEIIAASYQRAAARTYEEGQEWLRLYVELGTGYHLRFVEDCQHEAAREAAQARRYLDLAMNEARR